MCYVVNTAEYCAETVPALEEIIRGKIDRAYAQSIDLSAQQEGFHDVVATAIRALVAGLEVCWGVGPSSPVRHAALLLRRHPARDRFRHAHVRGEGGHACTRVS